MKTWQQIIDSPSWMVWNPEEKVFAQETYLDELKKQETWKSYTPDDQAFVRNLLSDLAAKKNLENIQKLENYDSWNPEEKYQFSKAKFNLSDPDERDQGLSPPVVGGWSSATSSPPTFIDPIDEARQGGKIGPAVRKIFKESQSLPIETVSKYGDLIKQNPQFFEPDLVKLQEKVESFKTKGFWDLPWYDQILAPSMVLGRDFLGGVTPALRDLLVKAEGMVDAEDKETTDLLEGVMKSTTLGRVAGDLSGLAGVLASFALLKKVPGVEKLTSLIINRFGGGAVGHAMSTGLLFTLQQAPAVATGHAGLRDLRSSFLTGAFLGGSGAALPGAGLTGIAKRAGVQGAGLAGLEWAGQASGEGETDWAPIIQQGLLPLGFELVGARKLAVKSQKAIKQIQELSPEQRIAVNLKVSEGKDIFDALSDIEKLRSEDVTSVFEQIMKGSTEAELPHRLGQFYSALEGLESKPYDELSRWLDDPTKTRTLDLRALGPPRILENGLPSLKWIGLTSPETKLTKPEVLERFEKLFEKPNEPTAPRPTTESELTRRGEVFSLEELVKQFEPYGDFKVTPDNFVVRYRVGESGKSLSGEERKHWTYIDQPINQGLRGRKLGGKFKDLRGTVTLAMNYQTGEVRVHHMRFPRDVGADLILDYLEAGAPLEAGGKPLSKKLQKLKDKVWDLALNGDKNLADEIRAAKLKGLSEDEIFASLLGAVLTRNTNRTHGQNLGSGVPLLAYPGLMRKDTAWRLANEHPRVLPALAREVGRTIQDLIVQSEGPPDPLRAQVPGDLTEFMGFTSLGGRYRGLFIPGGGQTPRNQIYLDPFVSLSAKYEELGRPEKIPLETLNQLRSQTAGRLLADMYHEVSHRWTADESTEMFREIRKLVSKKGKVEVLAQHKRLMESFGTNLEFESFIRSSFNATIDSTDLQSSLGRFLAGVSGAGVGGGRSKPIKISAGDDSQGRFRFRFYAQESEAGGPPAKFRTLAEKIIRERFPDRIKLQSARGFLKRHGVTDAELEYGGVGDFLGRAERAGRTTVMKSELLEAATKGERGMKEVVLSRTERLKAIEEEVKPLRQRLEDLERLRAATTDPRVIEGYAAERGALVSRIALKMSKSGPKPIYEHLQYPGGKNYEERLYEWSGKQGESPIWIGRPEGHRWKESHWENVSGEGEGVVAHARIDERNISGGGTSKNIIELQSTLHQAGREIGYGDAGEMADKLSQLQAKSTLALEEVFTRSPKMQEVLQDFTEDVKRLYPAYDNLAPSRFLQAVARDLIVRPTTYMQGFLPERYKLSERLEPELVEKAKKAFDEFQDYSGALNKETPMPDFPFKETWPDLVIKKIVEAAVKEGHRAVTWLTGDQVAVVEKFDRLPTEQALKKIRGVREFYNHVLVDRVNALARKFGWKTQVKDFEIEVEKGDFEVVHGIELTNEVIRSVEDIGLPLVYGKEVSKKERELIDRAMKGEPTKGVDETQRKLAFEVFMASKKSGLSQMTDTAPMAKPPPPPELTFVGGVQALWKRLSQSSERELRGLGSPAAVKLADDLRRVVSYSEQTTGRVLRVLEKTYKGFGKADFEKLSQAEKEGQSDDPRIQKALDAQKRVMGFMNNLARSLKPMTMDVDGEWVEAEIPKEGKIPEVLMGDVWHSIFTQRGGKYEKLIQSLISSGQAANENEALKKLIYQFGASRVGGFGEYERKKILELPDEFFVQNPKERLGHFVHGFFNWYYQRRLFGYKSKAVREPLEGEQNLRSRLNEIWTETQDKGKVKIARKIAEDALDMSESNEVLESLTKPLRELNTIRLIGLSFTAPLKQLSQPMISSMFESGVGPGLRAIMKVLSGKTGTMIEKSGALGNDPSDLLMLSQPQTRLGRATTKSVTLFRVTDRLARRVGAVIGEDRVLKLIKTAQTGEIPFEYRFTPGATPEKVQQWAREDLARLGVKDVEGVIQRGRLTPQELRDVLQRSSDLWNFKSNALDLPRGWRKSPLANTILQFKSFGWQQARLVADVLTREVLVRKNPLPLIRLLAGTALTGELAIALTNFLTGDDRMETSKARRVLNDWAFVGTFGIMNEIAKSNLVDAFMGPSTKLLGQTIPGMAAQLWGGKKSVVEAGRELALGQVALGRTLEKRIRTRDEQSFDTFMTRARTASRQSKAQALENFTMSPGFSQTNGIWDAAADGSYYLFRERMDRLALGGVNPMKSILQTIRRRNPRLILRGLRGEAGQIYLESFGSPKEDILRAERFWRANSQTLREFGRRYMREDWVRKTKGRVLVMAD